MKLEVSVSIGEIVDKITILNIKLEKIHNVEKLKLLNKEKKILDKKLTELKIKNHKEFIKLKNELLEINEALWDIEDKIRIHEKDKNFDKEFIDLARSVYLTNDKRFAIKDKINQLLNSSIREIKSYEDY